ESFNSDRSNYPITQLPDSQIPGFELSVRVLSLDTTTRTGSVALVEDDAVLEERLGDPTLTAAERFPRELVALLESRGLTTRDVFSALYRLAAFPVFDPRRLVEVDPPAVGAPGLTLDRWAIAASEAPAVLVGDGAVAFAQTIGARYPDAHVLPHPALAGAIGR